jgi:putative endonuclease
MRPKAIGRLAEGYAVRSLTNAGFIIRERNFRIPEGEIDIVAEEGDVIVFVEVKARTSRVYGLPEESITPQKRERLLQAALTYLDEHQLHHINWRFDLIAIECSREGIISRYDHYRDVIEGS